MNTAIEKARTTGIAYVGVRNSCHFGAAGYYVNLAAKADMIGLAMANDIPSMVTPGARKPVLGTNPFSYAVPAGDEDPIFLDIASSAAAIGKNTHRQGPGAKSARHLAGRSRWPADRRRLGLSAGGRAAVVRRPQGIRHRLDDRSARGRVGRRRHSLGHCELERRRPEGADEPRRPRFWPSTSARSCRCRPSRTRWTR